MLYFEKAASSYVDAIHTCLKRGARLLEIHDQEEWSKVRSHLLFCLIRYCVRLHVEYTHLSLLPSKI